MQEPEHSIVVQATSRWIAALSGIGFQNAHAHVPGYKNKFISRLLSIVNGLTGALDTSGPWELAVPWKLKSVAG